MEHCTKCDGSGYLIEYAGIKNGICFECVGKRSRTKEELRKIRLERKEQEKINNEIRNELYELPLKIKNQNDFIEMLILKNKDEDFINEEINILKEMKNRLEELKSL